MGKISSLKPLKLFEMTLYCNVPCIPLLPKCQSKTKMVAMAGQRYNIGPYGELK